MNGARDEIWLVSNLAPPVHGVSMFNAALLEELERRGEPVRVFRIGSSRARSIGRFSVVKALRDGRLIARLLVAALWRKLRGGGSTVLYFTPSQGGPAVFRDAVVATIGRVCFDRVIGHVHGCSWLGRYRGGGLTARAMKHALVSCDQVICLGDRFTRAMREATGIDCVSVDNGAPAMRGEARCLPSNGAPLTLLYLGSFILSKGLWAAAEAAVLLHGRGRSVRLDCAGSWRKEAERVGFERHFREAMKRDVIRFLGLVDRRGRAKALLDANILVLPTRYPHEGQPLVLIEAMSTGVVPITTDQGGIPDLMSFAGAERLVAPFHDSGHGVARTIEALASDPEAYEALSMLCLERFRTHLTMERCATDILTVIRGGADPKMEAWESKQAAV